MGREEAQWPAQRYSLPFHDAQAARPWLPYPSQTVAAGHYQRKIVTVPHQTAPIRDPLSALRPIYLVETHSQPDQNKLFCHLLHRYHYLGLQATFVGENIRYLAYDVQGRPLGCLLFGSAAWKTNQ